MTDLGSMFGDDQRMSRAQAVSGDGTIIVGSSSQGVNGLILTEDERAFR